MRDFWDLVGDLLAPLSLLIAVEWMVAYHRKTRGTWRRTQMGRHLMTFMGVLAASFAMVTARPIWVEWLDYEDTTWFRGVRTIVFMGIPAVLIWRRILLAQAQQHGDERKKMNIPQHVRAYIYSLVTPIGAILVFYGTLSEAEVALWSGLLGAILMVGTGALAAANTPRKKGTNGSEIGNGPTERGL